MKATITNIEFEVLTGFANQDFQNSINARIYQAAVQDIRQNL